MAADNADRSAGRVPARNVSVLLCLAIGLVGGLIGGMGAGWLRQGSDPANGVDLPSIALLNKRVDALYARLDRQGRAAAGEGVSEPGGTGLPDDLSLRIQNLEERLTAAESSLARSSPDLSSSDFVTADRLTRQLDAAMREVESRMENVIRDELRDARKDARPTASRDDVTSEIRKLDTDLYRLSLRVTGNERAIAGLSREIR
ncbi:MAG: hypothetical protein GXX96_38990 [Planctomycetaceae bacterium]|nr:hypothetical protein [Planctomycetaceae bacterium]